MRFFFKMKKDSCSACFYITVLSSNTFQTDDLEALSFFGGKTSFHPMFLFGSSPLKPFSVIGLMEVNHSSRLWFTNLSFFV